MNRRWWLPIVLFGLYLVSDVPAPGADSSKKNASSRWLERLGRGAERGSGQWQADFRGLPLRTLTGLQPVSTGRLLVWTRPSPMWRANSSSSASPRMRGVDLGLCWISITISPGWVFFSNADGFVYGRYGGRDADSADSRVSLTGLRYALNAALRRHRGHHAETTPATGQANSHSGTLSGRPTVAGAATCIHCHQVNELHRESLQEAGK